eukprot:scaffold12009_cov20-Tisochrysis_lutea.AAC.1
MFNASGPRASCMLHPPSCASAYASATNELKGSYEPHQAPYAFPNSNLYLSPFASHYPPHHCLKQAVISSRNKPYHLASSHIIKQQQPFHQATGKLQLAGVGYSDHHAGVCHGGCLYGCALHMVWLRLADGQLPVHQHLRALPAQRHGQGELSRVHKRRPAAWYSGWLFTLYLLSVMLTRLARGMCRMCAAPCRISVLPAPLHCPCVVLRTKFVGVLMRPVVKPICADDVPQRPFVCCLLLF